MTTSSRFRPDLLAPLLNDLARLDTPGEIRVRGTSMSPTLLPGDRLQIVRATVDGVRIGEVVVWVGRAGPIAHRLVGWWKARGEWQLLTKGDRAIRLDPPVPGRCLVARAVARVRTGRIRRLDEMRMRLCGRGRAAASLFVGLILEVWDRARRCGGWHGC